MLIYIVEPSDEGMLTAFYRCCKEKQVPDRVLTYGWSEVGLEDEVVTVEPDSLRARRVLDWLENTCGRQVVNMFYAVLDSGSEEKYGIILRFLLCVYKYGSRAVDMKNLGPVVDYDRLYMQVMYEVERLCGFVRFRAVREISSSSGKAFDVLYGGYRSDNDILQRVAGYFSDRNNGIPFVLHDMGREKAALYNGERIVVVPLSGRLEMAVDEDEMKYSAMFKKYFSAVSIATRKNPRLQRSFLPVRYRECMTEFQT